MSVRKYRLAVPINDDETNVSYKPTLPISLQFIPRTTQLKNVETATTKTLLNNKQKTEETIPSISSSPRWWLVLPCLLCIMLSSASDRLLLNDLVIRRYERYYGLDESSNRQRQSCRQSTTNAPPMFYWQFRPPNQWPLQNRPDYTVVQRAAASFQIKNSIAVLIPSLVSSILLGSNCDIIGRRPLLVLPFIGKVISYSLMLIVVTRDLSDAWLITATSIDEVFGSMGLVMLSGFAYITDCTQESTRTRAFLLTEGIVFLTRIIPVLAIGIWLRFYRYMVPLSACLGISVIGLIYALFVQPESVESVRKTSLIRQLAGIRLKPIVRIVTVFIVQRVGNNRKQLIFITMTMILLHLLLLGYFSVFALYLYGRPLCLDSLPVSLISSVQSIVTFVLSLLTALCKKSFDNTYLTPMIGAFALIVNLIIISFAKRIWLLYVAACIGSLFFITMPVLRTKLTGLIETNEYATVFVGISIIQTIGLSLIGAAANSIYNASINFFPGLIFSILAATGLIPIVIMGYLTCLERKTSYTATTQTALEDDL